MYSGQDKKTEIDVGCSLIGGTSQGKQSDLEFYSAVRTTDEETAELF